MKYQLSSFHGFRGIPAKIALALLSCCLLTQSAFAQDELTEEEQSGPLTVENLIGSAVSLSNRDYPEIENAIQRFRNGDVKGSLEYLNQAKDKYPKLPPTDVTLAKMQLAARNAQAVRLLLERAVMNHPDDPEAYLLLADQAFIGGRLTESFALFEYAESLVGNFTENNRRKDNFEIRVIAGRSAIAERRQQWEKAKDLLQQWIKIDPDSAAAHQRLGVTLFHLKDPKAALKEFQTASKLSDRVGHPFIVLGQLFYQDEDFENARKSYEKAYGDSKDDANVARAYAEYLIRQDELDKAAQVAADLLKSDPDSVDAMMLDGIVAYMQGNAQHAEQSLSQVLTKQPSNAGAMNLLALLLIENNDTADKERALRYAQMNAQLYPNNVQANVTLAWVLYNLKRGAEAQAALKRASESGKLQNDSLYLVARIMSDQEGQVEQSIKILEQLTEQKAGLFLFRNDAEELLAKLKNANR